MIFNGFEKEEGRDRKHPEFRENAEDRPPSKVLELRGIRRLWVNFATLKAKVPMNLERWYSIS
jgi:hypothetical protein